MKQRIRQSLPAVGVLLVASLVLGLAYNSASPLGVRSASKTEAAISVSGMAGLAQAAPPMPPSNSAPPVGYQNQTVGMTLEALATRPSSPTPAPQPTTAITPMSHNPPTPGHQHTHAPAVIASLGWTQVKEIIGRGNAVLVDARPASQYQAEHIPGAVSLPAGTAVTEIAAFVEKHGRNKTYIVYCGSGQCGLSKTVAESLRTTGGAIDVKTFPGGYAEYRVAEPKAGTP